LSKCRGISWSIGLASALRVNYPYWFTKGECP
jgi:hypothetical protein